MKILLFLLIISSAWGRSLAPLSGETILDNKKIHWNWENASRATVVIFLSAVCPCSNGHVPYLKKLKEDFSDYNFIGIHSNIDEDQKTTLDYFKQVSLNFEIIQDSKSHFADLFNAYRTPHSYIVSKEGKILYQGGVTGSSRADRAEEFYLYEALKEHQSGKDIKTPQTRVLGCEISRN